MLVRHRDLFPRSAVLMSACFDLGCVVYWLVPTAPPWYAGANGQMPPVRRIMAEAGERFWRRLWHPLYHSLQGNPFAAMPSLHFGTSVMAARILSQVGRGHAAAGWAYALTLGFGLVYLGEHYVIDLLAGLALAEGIWRVAPACGAGDPDDRRGRASTGAAGRLMAADDRRREERLRSRGRRVRGGRRRRRGAARSAASRRCSRTGASSGRGSCSCSCSSWRSTCCSRRSSAPTRRSANFDEAKWYWILVAIGFNVLAFGAYVALFRGVLGGTRDDDVHRRLDLRASYQITMAGLAATRIFSAAGAGGIVLTYWALRKAGVPRRRAACRMVAFLVLTYFVYLSALVVFGVLLRVPACWPAGAPLAGTVVPAAISGGIIILFLLIARSRDDFERRIEHYAGGYRRARYLRRIAKGPATLAMGTRTAIAYVRHPSRGLLAVGGAAGFWAANIGILWASFEAFGGHVPFAVLVQGFFVGMAANLIPSPAGGVGAVDAGMIGAFSIFGIDDSVVFPAVLTYRVIAFWLPIPPGIVAFVQLRGTVARWEQERGAPASPMATLQKVK